MKKAPRNIAITFDNSLTSEFIRLSEYINKKVPSKVVLNHNDALPHLSIYITEFPVKNLEKISTKLREIVSSSKPFKLILNKKSLILGMIFIDAEITEELYDFHVRVVDGLSEFRERLYPTEALNLPGINDGNRKSLVDYGMWAAKELYLPHVTVARPIDSGRCNEAREILPEVINYNYEVKEINLVEVGPNGTCKKILETYSFLLK